MHKYEAWARRVQAFIARMGSNPCIASFRFENFEPASDDVLSDLSRRGIVLPNPITEFQSKGSSGLGFSYDWIPPDETLRAKIDEEFGHSSLIGGLRVPWRWEYFSKYLETIERLMTLDPAGRSEGCERKLFPFWIVGKGDFVALDTTSSAEDGPIVYVSIVGESPCTVIASSFECFLTEWERMCYFDLTLATRRLRNPRSGFLDGNLPRAQVLRELLGVQEK